MYREPGRGRAVVGQRFHPYSPAPAPAMPGVFPMGVGRGFFPARHPPPPMPFPGAVAWPGRMGAAGMPVMTPSGVDFSPCVWSQVDARPLPATSVHGRSIRKERGRGSLPPSMHEVSARTPSSVTLPYHNHHGLSSQEVMATHAAAVVAAGNGAGARRGPPPSRASLELNKQIQRCSTASELCGLIACSAHGFNHVNVATAYRKLLQAGRGGVPRGAMERALQQLEECALQQMPAFGAQAVANTLHIFAQKRHGARDLLAALEARAGEVAGECNPQEVANMLWAYATMGRRPGEGVLGALEARAMAGGSSMGMEEPTLMGMEDLDQLIWIS